VIRRLAIRWAGNVAALFVASWVLPGVGYGGQGWTLLIAAAVFTLVNLAVKPVVTVLSLPLIVLTLGFFLLVINVLMLYITDWIVPDFEISGFGWGLLGAIIVSLVNAGLNAALRRERERWARERSRWR
jgi:putative membrane protein